MKANFLKSADRVALESSLKKKIDSLDLEIREGEKDSVYYDQEVEKQKRRASKSRMEILIFTLQRDALLQELYREEE